MIYLHTGLPGAGKTLYTLQTVRDRAKSENRAVYYHGIEILKPEEFPDWQQLDDATQWHTLPDGAIIVHDECQTLYRPRGNGSQVPEHVAKMETHRHKGHDLYLITQHPMLVDTNVRRLAGEHCHIVRAFGAKLATVHKWQQVKEQCDKSRSDSMQASFAYPASLFTAYKSATVHTHKFKMPGRVWLLLMVPLMFAALVWAFYQWYTGKGSEKTPEKTAEQMSVSRLGGGRDTARPKTTSEWIAEQTPRVTGLPHTAPVYDKVTAATIAPLPAACVATATRCLCYTQQATRMDTDEALCRQIAETGYFVAFDPTANRRGPERGRVSDTAPDRPAPQSSIEPRSVPMPL